MYFMLAWVVIFGLNSRQPSPCRRVTKTPSPQLLSLPQLTNRDARNPFRIRSYAKWRVPLAFSSQTLQRADVPSAHKSFKHNTCEPPTSVANKRLTAKLNSLDATGSKNHC